jgi:uncharacterized membrane protein YfhO
MTESYITQFYEWSKWEGIAHNTLLLLVLYIIYRLIANKNDRSLPNILLFTIIIALDTLIHQNINIKNNKNTTYL